jgi:hypothetical protein
MMFKTPALLAIALATMLSTAGVRGAAAADALPAPSNLAMLLDTIRTNRRALVAVNLNLSPQEAEKFWPLYDRYQEQLNPVGDRLAALVQDYITHFRDLSDEKALQLVQDYLAVEADRIRIRREFIGEFAKILPGRTVARFFQIENKMDAVIRYDLASTIPVVEEAPATAQK